MTITRKTTRLARTAPWIVGALCALLPLTSQALGLGRLKVHSALNQPLNAEIEFSSLTEAETKGLTIGLAGRSDFTAAGIDRAAHLSQIRFAVDRRADGRYVLRITTPTPFQEPFLHVLLQLDWTGGRLVREYTALIDPPTVVAAKPPAVEPPRVEPRVEPVAPEARPELAPSTPAVEEPLGPPAAADVTLSADGWPSEAGVAPKAASPRTAAKGRIGPAPSWATTARHTVRRGETLWSISEKVRRDPRISVQQAALAIYRNNPEAFYDNNLNNIRTGKILRVPERDAVESLSKQKAHTAFQEQFDAWQEYKRRLAGASRTVAAAEPAADEKPAAPGRADGGAEARKPAAPEKAKTADTPARKETAAAAKGQRSDELLKIVRANLQGEKGAGAPKAVEPSQRGEREQAALAERAETLEESLASKQAEQKVLREKLDLVRAQLKREARLIEIESQALAPAPGKTAAPAEAPKAEPPKAAEAPKTETPKVETPKVEAPKTEPAAPVAPKMEAPAPVPEKPKAETPKPVPKKPLPPPPAPTEKDMFGGLQSSLSDLFLPIVLGVVVLASAAIGLVYLRRRRRATAEFEESILASQAVATENVPTREATADASVAESSILSDISQGHIANIHTDEVDPIAEAEVYLAYGRDETAEEILKDAMVKHPQRQELKIKLLEIYAGRKDMKAFETLAEEVYAAIGGQGGKLWARVEELGQKVSPANPMFRGAAPTRTPEEKPAAAPAVKDAAPVTVASAGIAAPPAATMPPETALDFDLGAPAVTVPAAAKEDTFDLDFDLGETKPAPAAPAAGDKKPESSPAPEKDAGAVPGRTEHGAKDAKPAGGTDFDLGLESFDLGTPSENTVDFDLGQTSVTPVAPAKDAAEPSAGGDFSFDLAGPETGTAPGLATGTPVAPPAGGGSQHQWDEAATKLDLARAYIDMGDAEGARSILEEVMTEGNPEQKKQAQDLVAQIR